MPPPSAAFLAQLEQQYLIRSNVPGTFAHDSYVDRLPKLILDVGRRNAAHLSDDQQVRLQHLADGLIQDAAIPLPDEIVGANGPTSGHWTQLLRGKGYTWQQAPWFLSEHYMFHVVLIITGFFDGGVDPFHASKVAELQETSPWSLLQSAVNDSAAVTARDDAALKRLIKLCLWGNKADGCYTKVKDTVSGAGATLAIDDSLLLVDHSDEVVAFLKTIELVATQSQRLRCVQWINDNCGTELLLDLALADHLLTHGWCDTVVFHVKQDPMYISDACVADVEEHIAAMRTADRTPEVRALGDRLATYLTTHQLTTTPNAFWNQYTFYWEMPDAMQQQFATDATLVILKGDLNYRRLLGDRMWPATTPLEVAVPYFPAPFVSFRTLKSNPIVGLTAAQEQQLDCEDPEWRFNGKRGTIMGVGLRQ